MAIGHLRSPLSGARRKRPAARSGGGSEAHARAIVRTADRQRFAAVLPGTEPSLRALADHPVDLPHGGVLGLDSADARARATDKQLLLGRRPEVGAYRVGVSYRVLGKDLCAAGHTWRSGRGRDALEALVPRRGTVHGALSMHDPRPLLAGLHKVRRRLVRLRRTALSV